MRKVIFERRSSQKSNNLQNNNKKQNLPCLALETYFLQFSLCTQNCGHENKKAKAVTPPQSFKNIFKFLSIQISIALKIVYLLSIRS